MTDTRDSAEEDVGLHSLKRPGSVMSRTAYGTGWVIGWRLATRALGLLSTLVLVRLLAPSDFGIVALAMSFVSGLNQISELGTENAIIRADKHDRALYDTGFTINVLRGTFVAIMLLLLAVPASHFFHSPHFKEVVMVAAAVSFLNGFENIGIVDFRRFIAFGQEFRLKIIPRIVSVATAITLAFLLRDFWALIIAILVNQFLTLILSYRMHPYRPRFTLSAWQRIAAYSTMLWLNNLTGLLGNLGTKSMIGKLSGIGAVGIFEVGMEIASLPSTELVGPLTRSAFAGFAEIRKSGNNGAEMLVRIVGIMTLITLPAGVGLSLIATPLVEVAFGHQWIGAIPILQILGVALALTTFSHVSGTVFAVHSWMKAMIKINVTLAVVQLLLLAVLLPSHGLLGAAIAIAITQIAAQVVFFYVAIKRLDIRISEIILQIWRSVLACIIMIVTLVALGRGWTSPTLLPTSSASVGLQLAETVLLGAAVYAGSVSILWLLTGRPRGPESDLLAQISSLFKRSRSAP
ncbi:lipopolysaccharide biosynthesis protein [Acidihalobacter yilgarnensis]|uniref:Lipopolysaccharide biosynthesis protein n=1 Tax=Acidihalobacter yilgarnensis TaxID=2819280 RepID=A0A1D8IPZ1_9GAMM|nr:oligosaccharide flippase family protein [Acidihalobacter yilgarnensis]AOU98519.1 lipopolysaccharide biosynthesis protein [Acidihalobacter yilgarnensis]